MERSSIKHQCQASMSVDVCGNLEVVFILSYNNISDPNLSQTFSAYDISDAGLSQTEAREENLGKETSTADGDKITEEVFAMGDISNPEYQPTTNEVEMAVIPPTSKSGNVAGV